MVRGELLLAATAHAEQAAEATQGVHDALGGLHALLGVVEALAGQLGLLNLLLVGLAGLHGGGSGHGGGNGGAGGDGHGGHGNGQLAGELHALFPLTSIDMSVAHAGYARYLKVKIATKWFSGKGSVRFS
ncbi:hypothetical protein CXB45_01850 [Corynebacterium mastitidis]|uniref:Uncharacterized protein n=1 Tax=Corynebacterium mastitidis TaxID=161890 RepID=A0A2N0X9R2_9CORY|nr:hypothetical protein CXB45_01850 [Corynebacterium mastitidis]